MENTNLIQPVLASPLPKSCYTDVNEFVQDLLKVLRIPSDSIIVLRGADGAPGEKGDRGEVGPAGPRGADGRTPRPTAANIPIPNGATYVDIDVFPDWGDASYTVHFAGEINPSDPNVPSYTHQGSIGVGQIVPISGGFGNTPTKLRVYFTFTGISAVPNGNFRLRITSWDDQNNI